MEGEKMGKTGYIGGSKVINRIKVLKTFSNFGLTPGVLKTMSYELPRMRIGVNPPILGFS
jgi:hypothetical protein